jgi:PAS domain S-box-containing protein
MQNRFSIQKKIIDKKNAEVKQISKQVEAKKKELGNLNNTIKIQRYALITFTFLLAIIIILAVWIFRNYRKMKEQNIILEQQKNEIAAQALELEKINIELEKLSIVASQTNNAVSILKKDGTFNWVNSGFTKLYGYTLQLLENELDNNIIHSPLYEGIEQTFLKSIKTKESAYFEHKTITRNKKILWIQTSITPILDYNNEVKLVVLVDSDISAIKEAEQQIAEQNKNIKKSILYASRIQNATLPSQRILTSYFPQIFILYLPRDIVSGDFYWAAKVKDKKFVAAADCTGHGVPGAFMSMLGITLLNEIVTKETYEILRPDLILSELRKKLINALNQSEKENTSSDGIAIALCMIDEKNKKIHYAGAENEMILIRNNNLFDYMADDIPIGISTKEQKKFTNNIIEYQKNDMIYMFSDGYVDQFGGPGARRKKFLIKRLRELLLKIHTENLEKQKEILLETHLEWKGKNKQVDDILILGIKL